MSSRAGGRQGAQNLETIGIIGGGPAGAMTAACLMRSETARPRSGMRALVFEERLNWEKPCGGGVSRKALRRYPFLGETQNPGNPVWEMEIWAPGGAGLRLRLREPLVIYSRRDLNLLLLDRSREAGAEVVPERIIGLTRQGNGWEIKGSCGVYHADYVVLAAGALSRLRENLAGNLNSHDFMLTFGHYVPAGKDKGTVRIEFFKDFEGYAWSFPRADHLSIGVCGKVGQAKMVELRRRLDGFIKRCGLSVASAPVFSHLLPSLDAGSWTGLRLSGPGWSLAGDAAGLVDPITGEGIYFALRSGELLAESLLAGFPEQYAQRVWNEFGSELMSGSKICRRFYCGDFWGDAVTARMLQFSAGSKTFRDLFVDLLEGTQPYAGLQARLYRILPKVLLELVWQVTAQRFRSRVAL
jgi:geranylgeranyl diphosphate/geranylgeranyl-bacteriochlorophyllide a reductase